MSNRQTIREDTRQKLHTLGIEFPSHLPLLEADTELNPQPVEVILGKICALGYVIGMAYTPDTDSLSEQISKYSLWPYVSPLERSCLEDPNNLTEEIALKFGGLAESVYALSWCLRIVNLEANSLCPDNLADLTVPGNTPEEFVKGKILRPNSEILAEADFYYCFHWHERQCSIERKEPRLGENVIWERRRALDWAIGVSSDWDNMPSDT